MSSKRERALEILDKIPQNPEGFGPTSSPARDHMIGRRARLK
jgi:hypothetical protein